MQTDGTVVDEAVEQDRARVGDDAARVLEQRREHVQVGVARRLDDDVRHVPIAAANRSSQLVSRGCGRKRSEKRPRRPLSSHQRTTRSTKRLSYGVFVGVFPITVTSGRPGSRPYPRSSALVVLPRTLSVVHVRLRPAGDDDPAGCDRRGSERDRRASRRSGRCTGPCGARSRPCRRCGPSSPRSPTVGRRSRRAASRNGTTRSSGGWRRRLPGIRRRIGPSTALGPSAARCSASAASAVDRGMPRQRPDPGKIEPEVPVSWMHPLQVKAVAQVEPDRERVEADPAVEPEIDPAQHLLSRPRPDGEQLVPPADVDPVRRAPATRRSAPATAATRA